MPYKLNDKVPEKFREKFSNIKVITFKNNVPVVKANKQYFSEISIPEYNSILNRYHYEGELNPKIKLK